MSEAQRALADRLEAHTEQMANTSWGLTMQEWNVISNDILLAARTLRAALTPPSEPGWLKGLDEESAIKEIERQMVIDPEADDEVAAIRARHEAARSVGIPTHVEAMAAHADRATLLRALDAERARRLADMQAAFDAGFMVSGEGWNGEYPGDAPGTEYYIERRIEAIATLTKDTP